jgi:hypothetical protein
MDALAFDAGAVTAVIGYTAQVKRFLPENWAKASVLVSCALGVLYAVSLRPGKHELGRNIVSGIMIGLAASGGFAGMKNLVEARAK